MLNIVYARGEVGWLNVTQYYEGRGCMAKPRHTMIRRGELAWLNATHCVYGGEVAWLNVTHFYKGFCLLVECYIMLRG